MNLSCRVLIATLFLLLTLPQHLSGASPLIVAHRGLLKVAPENTIANFRACLELRLGFEFDVQRTKDGHLVCMHDSTVNRTTDGTGKVSDLTLAEIKKLDAGNWFDSQFAGERVPTIDEVLQLVARYRQHEILVAVDFKDADVEQDVVRLAEKHQVLPRLIFIGRTITEPQMRMNLKAASPKVETAAVANNAAEFSTALAAPHADWVYLRYLAPASEIKKVHTAHKRTFIAGPTVSGDLPENWRRITKAGVDAILTDYPLQLRLALKRTP
ncbi:Glycerophosphoryl diester phosphodiesterase [Gimesia panareensis]|uniref:Glycerophosphoryl diester phosphodiesterase n=1 Tax=Gimesia panareensis TaxID=2527978 RepID=A0A517QC42_9PLAN|nr:glycerophosphodiester phosphodiesterase family protein [Gimesia panareensis]QDT29196.1 Glycerophosphoryl diester phosphodiesterase [Gimesia panareensis]